jgi:hypothetical protein
MTEPSDPSDEDRDAEGDRGAAAPPGDGERPMSIPVATGWTIGATLLFLWLLTLIVSIRPDAQFDLISAFGCQAAAYLLGLFGILRVHAPRASIREFLGVRATHPAFYPIAVLLGLALEAPVSAVYDAIERRFPSGTGGDAELVKMISEAHLGTQIALCVVLVALGPAIEEVFFRGALTRPLRRRHGPATVIALTAALFAVAHFQPQKFLPIGLFGVALGLLRYSSGSLLPSVLVHATYNAIPLVATLADAGSSAGAEPPPGADGAPIPPWIVAGSSALAAGLLALAWIIGARTQDAARARERDRP